MTSLLAEHTGARTWLAEQRNVLSRNGAFGRIEECVVWADTEDDNGDQLVPVDPNRLVDEINTVGLPLLVQHDPGTPAGRVIAAKLFASQDGRQFVAAVAGLYTDETSVSFADFGINGGLDAPSPPQLPPLPVDFTIYVGADPREVDPVWLDGVVREGPLEVIRTDISHNTAESVSELIRIALPYIAIVWNPFVTTIAKEAGKATYAALEEWFLMFLGRLSELKSPIVEIQSHHRHCLMSFLFRGNDVQRLYAAHEGRAIAAAQAAKLVDHLIAKGVAPRALMYEFDHDAKQWYPSFAELEDGRIVTDRNILIAFENLPSGLSLGLVQRDDPRLR
jgi:hypothetical protein